MSLSRFVSGLLDRVFILAGAFVGSQAPSFMQQYFSRLSGHIDELHYQIQQWSQMAAASGKSLPGYIQKFAASGDNDFSRHGDHMQAMIYRLNDLSQAYQLIQESSLWSRPFIFISHVNSDILKATIYTFVPQLTLTLEGACYTFVGFALGYGLFHLVRKVFRSLRTRKSTEP
jgi:hypothetical protein